MSADDLPTVVPDGFPRYHFFLFKHSFEGDYQESVGKQLHSLISSVLRVKEIYSAMIGVIHVYVHVFLHNIMYFEMHVLVSTSLCLGCLIEQDYEPVYKHIRNPSSHLMYMYM